MLRPYSPQEYVIRAFGDKVFKVVVAALDILHQALRSGVRHRLFVTSDCCLACSLSPLIRVAGVLTRAARRSAFGPGVIAPQPLLKALPPLFDAKQEPVRDGVKKLTVCFLVPVDTLVPATAPQ